MSPAEGSTKLYECNTPTCPLGGIGQPGYFTGGLTLEGMAVLSGPKDDAEEGVDYGSGVCPNCGQPGTDTETFHKSLEGDDA